jgi:hypothetical protein
MPKKKKTREQKIIADRRHKIIAPSLEKPSAASVPLRKIPTAKSVISTSSYSYLNSDLIKTLILTSSIIIIEIVFRYIFGA